MNIETLTQQHMQHLAALEHSWEKAYQTLTTNALSIEDHIHEAPCLTCEDAWYEGRKEMLMEEIEADIKLHKSHLRLLKELALSAPSPESYTGLEEW